MCARGVCFVSLSGFFLFFFFSFWICFDFILAIPLMFVFALSLALTNRIDDDVAVEPEPELSERNLNSKKEVMYYSQDRLLHVASERNMVDSKGSRHVTRCHVKLPVPYRRLDRLGVLGCNPPLSAFLRNNFAFLFKYLSSAELSNPISTLFPYLSLSLSLSSSFS
jgi:hypothetical protein